MCLIRDWGFKMRIALHDADSTNFPNLALMKLSAWHKARGDHVERFMPLDRSAYDVVYSSSVFIGKPAFTDLPDNALRGGTGYGLFENLPDHIEHICPDYSLYRFLLDRKNRNRKKPEPEYSLGFLTRGCPNNCPWCIVPRKEGQIRAHADIEEFCRHKYVVLMDNNVLACDHGIDQIEKMARLGLRVDFNQGLDARLIDEPIARRLGALKWFKPLRLACDRKAQMPAVEKAVKLLRAAGCRPVEYFCYVLVKDVDDGGGR